jgi:predicted RNase H-like HicB family nuclease
MKSWTDRIRQHALVHYTENGWDILVECWPDSYIQEHFRGCKTYEEAVTAISEVLHVMDGYRSDIQAEIF